MIEPNNEHKILITKFIQNDQRAKHIHAEIDQGHQSGKDVCIVFSRYIVMRSDRSSFRLNVVFSVYGLLLINLILKLSFAGKHRYPSKDYKFLSNRARLMLQYDCIILGKLLPCDCIILGKLLQCACIILGNCSHVIAS